MRRLILAALLCMAPPALASELPAPLAVVVDRAAAEDLPVDALEAKAREGLAKGVPEARIAMVLEALAADLSRARGVLGDVPAPVLYSASRALKHGASEGAVEALAASPVAERALHSLADLLALGVAESDATRVVRVAAAGPKAEHQLPGIATATAALVARGSTPGGAAAEVLAGLAGNNNGAGSLPESGPGKGKGKEVPGKGLGLDNRGTKSKAPGT